MTIEQPDMRPISRSGNMYALQTGYTYGGFTVPSGYNSDLASVPRALYTITGLLPDGVHRAAALMHDYLYDCGGRATRDGLSFIYSRKFADQFFRGMLQDLGLPKWQIVVLYVGVRIGGSLSWRGK